LSQSKKNCPFLGSKKLKSIKKLKKVQIVKVQKSSKKLKKAKNKFKKAKNKFKKAQTSSNKLKQAQIRYSHPGKIFMSHRPAPLVGRKGLTSETRKGRVR
jgi:hypothetical protein